MNDMEDDPAARLQMLADLGCAPEPSIPAVLPVPPGIEDFDADLATLANRAFEQLRETTPAEPPPETIEDRARHEVDAALQRIRARRRAADASLTRTRARGRTVDIEAALESIDLALQCMNSKRLQRAVNAPIIQRAATLADVNQSRRVITILAVPYEDPTPVLYDGERWTEVVSRSAFNGFDPNAPKARPVPVSAVLKAPAYSHEGAHLVGRVVDADTNHPDGLVLETRISKTPVGDEVLTLANDGALHPSIGFVSPVGRDTQSDRRNMTRRVNRAFLDHLTYVPTPAYDGAKVLGIQ